MTFRSCLVAAACSAFLAIAIPQISQADELTAGQKSEVERILRDYLIAHSTQPHYVYRHKWRVGDLLMWDNCATQHCAVANYALPLRRCMQRATVRGSVPY